ncbi:MAG: hypothetical protein REI12_10605 [Pedobacter sp.]|nr:hypothetical protein [Pedobacter sp.]
MTPSTALKMLVFSLTALSAGVFAATAEERPRMEDYPSSYAFLQALESWNKAHPNGTPASKPTVTTKPTPQVAQDPTSELAPPPFEVTGPESLDTAVEKARNIAHPAYKEKIRYQRSTHLSFPLHSIDGQDMSQVSVGDSLDLKGQTEEEKKLELQKLTLQLEQDKLNAQQNAATTDRAALSTQQHTLNNNALMGSTRTIQDISVVAH